MYERSDLVKLNFRILKYSFKYILIILITHFTCQYLIGIPNLYKIHISIMPFYNYLLLNRGIMIPLSKDLKVNKKDIMKSFLIITSLFNIIFFRNLYFTKLEVSIILVLNIIEFILMKPPIDKISIATQKNIDEYFKRKKKII